MEERSSNNKQYLRGALALLFTGFLFGTFGPIFKILNRSFSTFEITLYQNIIGLVASIVILVIQKERPSYKNIPFFRLLGFSISFPVTAITFSLAVVSTKVTTATFLFYGGSFIVSYLVSRYFFREEKDLIKTIALVVCLVGLSIYTFPLQIDANMWGYIFILISSISNVVSSGYRKSIGEHMSGISLLPPPLFVGAILSGILLLLFPTPLASITQIFLPLSFALLCIMGIRLLLINWLTLYGFQRVDLNVGTLILSSDILFATLLSVIFLKEIPAPKELIGAGIIALGITIANWPKKTYVKTT